MTTYLRSAFTVAVSSILVACALFMFTGSAQAALAQFDANTGGSPTQDGWSGGDRTSHFGNFGWNDPSGIDFNMSFVGPTSQFSFSDRGPGAGNVRSSPVPEVSRDWWESLNGFRVAMIGLTPNTSYNMRWHHYEAGAIADDLLFRIYSPDNDSAANLVAETGNFGGDTTNFYTDFVATSDSTGATFFETDEPMWGTYNPHFNGLEVLSIAEPQSFTDFDNSGTWNLDDLNLVLFNWQELEADLPVEWVNQRPAEVGLDQLNNVLFNWQQPSSLAVVPEPAGLALLLLGGLGPAFRRRRP